MTLGRKSTALVLVALYIGAVWSRFDSLRDVVYPYYNGESGTNFRHAQMIADAGRLPPIDEHASRPEGYAPARAKPTGVEHFAGYAMRLVRPFTDVSDRKLTGFLTIFVFSLSVFTMYALARRAWDCQAAGGFAALLAAFSAPLVGATDGREFLHAPYAFVAASLHLALFAGFSARPSPGRAALTALAAFALLGLWSSAGLYLAAFGLAVLVLPKLSPDARRIALASHLAAAIAAAVVFPHLRAERFVLAWPVVWLLVAAAYAFYGGKLPRRAPGWAFALAAFVILALALGHFRREASDLLDPISYWYYRLRFIGGKPEDPALLPDVVRIAWSHDHGPPSAQTLAEFFLPLAFLLVPAAGVLRARAKETGVSPRLFIAAAAGGTAAYLLDDRMVFWAALLTFPFVSGAFRGFGKNLRTRAVLAALALLALAASSPVTLGSADIVRVTGSRLGLSQKPSRGFVRASIGNADRDLVRVLVTRTSTRNDVFIAPPAISSLIATFAGRATVFAPGIHTRSMAAKTAGALSGFYADEEALVERCRFLGATYVVYSVDVLLDASAYSPRYISAAEGDVKNTLAYKMHFAPESLRRFQLVYENDTYRLFRLTAATEPVFLTDHPPVYQEEMLRAAGGSLGAFYAGIKDILATYHTAVEAQRKGDEEVAIRRFEYCLERAPLFTAARLGVGDSLLRMRKPEQAYEAYGRVLRYAPDNAHALYYGALSLAYSGRRGEALNLVDLLLTATTDRETLSEALELKAALAGGRRIALPGPEPPEDMD